MSSELQTPKRVPEEAKNKPICEFFRAEIDRIITHLSDPYAP